MLSLPVTAAPPPPSSQASAPTDNGAPQPAEPFGNVLARQRANAGTQDNKPSADKQSAASSTDAAASAASNETALQPPIPDAPSTLPADMLAALLPASVSTKNTTDGEKNTPQAAAPDGSGTLPGEMLAMLLPATAPVNSTTTNVKGLQEGLPDGARKGKSQPISAAALGEARQVAGNKAALGANKITEAPAQLRGQGNSKPEAADNISKENSFAVALDAFGKEGAKTALLAADAKKMTQPVESATQNTLLQSATAPALTSSSGTAQVAQATINTPVTHEAWGDEFNQKVTWMATQHEQTAELHLNPPNLGPLDVVLKVSGDQATALFTSPHAAVREAVEQALPKLRDMMADNGIMLGNATVNDQSPQDRQAWQAEQQQSRNGRSGGNVDTAIAPGDILSGATALSGRRHQGMLDTFA